MTFRHSIFCWMLISATTLLGDDARIQPWKQDTRYWQYNGRPVLLLGGTKDDNVFQLPDLESHLDELASVGGNYVRNTMSDRPDGGFEVYAFKQLPSGQYDLSQWNDEYWKRFESLLKLAQERDILVQIELWDRFDYTDMKGPKRWERHPYNPINNINYDESCGLATKYPTHHPSRDRQPFFHTIPGMKKHKPKYDVIRRYQEGYVDKLLSISLRYPNVLYCMNNETTTSEKWGQYWMARIRTRADEAGVSVVVTDMFDDLHEGANSKFLPIMLASPEKYDFFDVSQVNSRNFNEDHWNALMWIANATRSLKKPLNHTKIYSDGKTSFGSGTPIDGVERFWRNLIAGSASSRFHRPTAGIGLNDIARGCLQSARLVEQRVPFWTVDANQTLLSNRETDEAYVAANPGNAYVVYFTDGGSVDLNTSPIPAGKKLDLTWIGAATGVAQKPEYVTTTDGALSLSAPSAGGWVAVLSRPVDRYSMDDYDAVEKIDMHAHIHTEDTDFVTLSKRDRFRFVNMAVWSSDPVKNREKHRTAYLQLNFDTSRTAVVCSFPIENFDDDDFADQTTTYLDQQIAKGAIGVKVWKNIGMELRDKNGDLVMIDDPKFDPIFQHIADRGLVLLGHLGEPRNCWLPIDEMTTLNDQSYFSENPKYHMHVHPEMPSYEDQIAARDRMLAKNPEVTFIACHLASLEWSTNRMTEFLERFPNATIGIAARTGQLQYQSQRDRAGMIDFFTKYQDRILYGTDLGIGPGVNTADAYQNVRQRWQRDWRYFNTDETQTVPELAEPVQGLGLNKAIVNKLYRENAERIFNRSWRSSQK